MKYILKIALLLICFVSATISFSQEKFNSSLIYFNRSVDTLNLSFSNNKQGLGNLITEFKRIESDSTITILNIEIRASASPEGDRYSNALLCANRIRAIENYIKDNISICDSLIIRTVEGIAWSELRDMVSISEMMYREEVLKIMDNTPEVTYKNTVLVDSRNRQLMNLKWGRPYAYMREHFFPELQNSSVVNLYYTKEPIVALLPTLDTITKMNTTPVSDTVTALVVDSIPSVLEELDKIKKTPAHWYVGIQGSGLFGKSTLRSLSLNGIKGGYSIDIIGGYQINSVLSLEVSLGIGETKLASDNYYQRLWLSSTDGKIYNVTVIGHDGGYFNEIYSDIRLQQYSFKLNIDLLSLFTESRFSVILAPKVSYIGSSVTIKTITDDKTIIPKDHSRNLGLGGDLMVGYDLSKNLELRLSGGITHLVGDRIDGIIPLNNSSNFISNISFSAIWRFNKLSKSR